MKKKILPFMMSAALMMGMSACGEEKDNEPGLPGPGPVEEQSYGVFIVNAGNMYSNIDGSLQYIEYNSGNVFEDVFKGANNGQTVGDTFNSGFVLEDDIYLAVTDSKVVHIIDREDFELKKTISTADYNGGPRHIATCDGMVYVTTFGQPGYVVEIDPEKEEITRAVEVGPLPEYIVQFNNQLYVSVSDARGDGSQACVAVIDPLTLKVTKRITGLVNPVNLVTNGLRLFVCAWGQYMSEPPYTQYNYGAYEIRNDNLSDKLCDATDIWLYDTSLYYISFPYGTDDVKYRVYDIMTEKDSQWIDSKEGVDYPIYGDVDPITGDVFILSYELGESGYASYSTPGYVKRYTSNGAIVTTYKTGVGPTSIFFNAFE